MELYSNDITKYDLKIKTVTYTGEKKAIIGWV